MSMSIYEGILILKEQYTDILQSLHAVYNFNLDIIPVNDHEIKVKYTMICNSIEYNTMIFIYHSTDNINTFIQGIKSYLFDTLDSVVNL